MDKENRVVKEFIFPEAAVLRLLRKYNQPSRYDAFFTDQPTVVFDLNANNGVRKYVLQESIRKVGEREILPRL